MQERNTKFQLTDDLNLELKISILYILFTKFFALSVFAVNERCNNQRKNLWIYKIKVEIKHL